MNFDEKEFLAVKTVLEKVQNLKNEKDSVRLSVEDGIIIENFLVKCNNLKNKGLFKRIKNLPKKIGQKLKNIKHKRRKLYILLGLSVFSISVWYGGNSYFFLVKELKFQTELNKTLVQKLEQLEKTKCGKLWRTVQMTTSFIGGLYYGISLLVHPR